MMRIYSREGREKRRESSYNKAHICTAPGYGSLDAFTMVHLASHTRFPRDTKIVTPQISILDSRG